MAKVGVKSQNSPLQFYMQLNEAACLALRRSIEADEEDNEFRLEHFRRVAEEIVECLQACLTSGDCDLGRIYSFARAEIRRAKETSPTPCLKRALKALDAIHGLWVELGMVETRLPAAA